MRCLALCSTVLLVAPATAFGQAVRDLPASYPYPEPAWSPYLVGGFIGVLVMLTLTFSREPVAASSAYADVAGLLGRVLAPRHTKSLHYFQEHKPGLSWTLVFVVGAIGGAFVAAWSGGEITGTYLQDLWVARFGPESQGLRTAAALVGGMLMAFGARLAGGCTSGHGISGTLQLAVGSWIAVICFFAGGIATAMLLYRV